MNFRIREYSDFSDADTARIDRALAEWFPNASGQRIEDVVIVEPGEEPMRLDRANALAWCGVNDLGNLRRRLARHRTPLGHVALLILGEAEVRIRNATPTTPPLAASTVPTLHPTLGLIGRVA